MTLEELNLTCDRLEAAQACRNLVGKLSYFDSAFRTNDLIALWDTGDNVTLELPGVSLKGFSAVKVGAADGTGVPDYLLCLEKTATTGL